MDLGQLEKLLWDAACKIRGPVDAPKFKDYILPIVFLKRLSDVFADELSSLGEKLGGSDVAETLVEQDHGLVRFYIPKDARWGNLAKAKTGIGQLLTDAVREVAKNNPELRDVIDVIDFNATSAGQRIISDESLAALLQALGKHRLGLHDVEPDILGRAYEYLLRKFAEPGASAGEFYTPREVGVLMARILDPEPGMSVHDPCCGSGGLLIKSHLRLLESRGTEEGSTWRLPRGVAPLRLSGQEINPSTFAIARMNAFIHNMEAEIRLGDTMRNPQFLASGTLQRFDIVAANPMWNQDFTTSTYDSDGFERFESGKPPASSADWGWVQHMTKCLSARGRLAVVLDTGAVGRGSGSSGSKRERDIRRKLVLDDVIESIILLPENLFYNTTAPGIILTVNVNKQHPNEILLVNAAKLFEKGRPKNQLSTDNIAKIAELYEGWAHVDDFAEIISTDEAMRNDFNLSPTRYISSLELQSTLPVDDALVLLTESEVERDEADAELSSVLERLGLAKAQDIA